MICKRCHYESDNSSRICPKCGGFLENTAGSGRASDIRQGQDYKLPPVSGGSYKDYQRPAAQPFSSDSARPDHHRGVNGKRNGSNIQRKELRGGTPRPFKRRGVNYTLLFTILVTLILVMVATLFVVAVKTPMGHLFLMNYAVGDEEKEAQIIDMIGEEAAAGALWTIGTSQIDQGYITRSIDTYTRAYNLYPELDGMYNRLLELADAYEAAGMTGESEKVYKQLYSQIDKTNPLAYRYAISIMMDQDRLFEATDLMALAYANTGEMSFKSQREQLVPLSPTASLEPGRHMLECDTSLESPQGYDVYYLLDDEESELPENGILYTDPIHLTEGVHTIRAVCVSSSLVSDEISLKYTVWFPSPSAPKSRVLSGEYDTRKRIYLYMDPTAGDTEGQEYTIYYTIDGTAPNSESPIYTDEGFLLPGGRLVTVRAVAVNQYGKVSNELVQTFRINVKYQNYFRDEEDQFKDFTLGKSTYGEIKKKYGAGKEETIADSTIPGGQALLVTYDWGEMRFTPVENTLYKVETNYASMSGPRSTKVGMALDEVTAKFRDMGQVANARGNRSIYYDEAVGYGKYYKDSDTEARLEYVYWRADNGTTTLVYKIKNGVVSRITMELTGVRLP